MYILLYLPKSLKLLNFYYLMNISCLYLVEKICWRHLLWSETYFWTKIIGGGWAFLQNSEKIHFFKIQYTHEGPKNTTPEGPIQSN